MVSLGNNNMSTSVTSASHPVSSMSFTTSQLNSAQLKAVNHPPHVPLQILAGPGSGKTKVLTSRIANLILTHSMTPSSICAVTFTNKAANEMRERLIVLIGEERTSQVRMGTFHSLCAMHLRKYGGLVGLKSNFTICDADNSKRLITRFLKLYKDKYPDGEIALKDKDIQFYISQAKAKGQLAADFVADVCAQDQREGKANEKSESKSSRDKAKSVVVTDPYYPRRVVSEIFTSYEEELKKSNSLDFDDLLLYGVQLFSQHHKAVEWCKHVLVDEFQDTNTIQYQLLQALGFTRCVTVVGDPDQSIYGWRSAEVENLAKMKQDFPNTHQIYLEENYRSTGAILSTSLAIVAQDKTRIQKSLRTSHPDGNIPVLLTFRSEYEEACFIAREIKRVVAEMGGVLRWKDFVILLRFNALSRGIESALQKEAIPNRVLAGHKFFERLEVKDLLAYLQLVDNPQYDSAFTRVVNVPARGIGQKTLMELALKADKTGLSQYEVVELITNGTLQDIKPAVKQKLESFINTMKILQELARKAATPAVLIRELLRLIKYEDHLQKTQPDWESRWENVKELITFAHETESGPRVSYQELVSENEKNESEERDTPLRQFLQASMLSSEGDNDNLADSSDKVTITTSHAAKGLEWPVVMIPAVEDGVFPFYRSEDTEEERRLLYVACTRAQGLLYLSHVLRRQVAGKTMNKNLSEFLSLVQTEQPKLFAHETPRFSPSIRLNLAMFFKRPVPDEDEVRCRVKNLKYNNGPPVDIGFHNVLGYEQWPPIAAPPSSRQQVSSKPFDANTTPAISPLFVRAQIDGKVQTIRQQLVDTLSPQAPNKHLVSANQNQAPTRVDYPAEAPMLANTVQKAPVRSSSPGATPPPVGSNTGIKRRLGMGRSTTGYSNKKFKPPT